MNVAGRRYINMSEYRGFFVQMRAPSCLWSATWQLRIRSESKRDDKGDETTDSLIPRRERGRREEGRREAAPWSRKPAHVFLLRRAGTGSGPGTLRSLWKYSRATTLKGEEPTETPGLLFPAGWPGFANASWELLVENLQGSRASLNWCLFTLRWTRTKDKILISKGSSLSPFLKHFCCWIAR